ncbi:branched-chain amino acid ABC transporter permease [Microbacterium sp. NPDC055910]|uniref:branched-chain amino acid ABC transporter permease n=1 Tax=Microbacterium sp. NPDC055910 TaxID=3345659 RepID=UPI0035DB8849
MQELLNAATLGSIYLLFALGMALPWGTIGVLNFAYGSTFMFSALVVHLVSKLVVLPMLGALLLAVLIGAVISVLTQLLVFQPIVKRSRSHHQAELRVIIGGIGVSAIPLAIAEKVTVNAPFGIRSSYEATVIEIAGLRVSSTGLIIIVVGLAIGIGVTIWLRRSKQGLALRGIGTDAETAQGMGVNRDLLGLGTMAVAGALAGLAGGLLTFYLSAISPESGDTLLIKAFAIIVLGGLGSMGGVILGAYVLAGAETIMTVTGQGSWVDAAAFGLIFVILLLRPQGLFGRKEVRRT